MSATLSLPQRQSAADGRWVDRRSNVGFLRGPIAGRTWREFGLLVVMLPLAPFALAYGLFAVVLTAVLSWTVVGLPVAGAVVRGARAWGGLYRTLAHDLLEADVARPLTHDLPAGYWRRLRARIADGPGWRAVAFLFVIFPLAIVAFCVTVTHLAVALGLVTNGIWARYLPATVSSDGTARRGISFGPDWVADTTDRQIMVALLGLVLLWLFPPMVRAFAHLVRLLVVGLLGPTFASLRVAALERSRSHTIEDAAERLRRIERDLHDGTQARLVAIAMQLGEAVDLLADQTRGASATEGGTATGDGSAPGHGWAPGHGAAVATLVATAHESTKEALVELRELARGIHPPALDNGLAVALETLAARSPIAVDVHVDPDVRPSQALEAIAYFCVAELVTNVVKHARATRADVAAEQVDGHLRLRVADDGGGGAGVHTPDDRGHRSGLAGLAERVQAVDGDLTIDSPVGGPTVVTVVLPTRV